MKRIGMFLIVLISCLSIASCKNISGDDISGDEKIKSPMLVSVFPNGTTRESYLIILSEDGTIETFVGVRKDIQINESEYSNDAVDWFVEIESRDKCELDSKDIKIINDLLNEVSFSDIQSQRRIIRDGWERMLFIDSKPYYKYGIEDEDSLTRLINQIIEYSPINVDIHGW